MFGKVLVPCSRERVSAAIEGYVKTEQEVNLRSAWLLPNHLEEFRRVADMLYGDLFATIDQEVFDRSLVPKHGPGATADNLRGNGKYRNRLWTARLEEHFPSGEYLIPNKSFEDELAAVHFLEPGSEMPAKVITVPKTLKTPRIIAKEPTHMQYVQQALREALYDGVQESDFLRPMIGFRTQKPNQRLARKGSLTGSLATLDLSDASDRVSNRLVQELLFGHPHLQLGVEACRSTHADVPGHGVLRLAKFASMGSALTFPIEAMVFLTCVMIGIGEAYNTPVTPGLMERLRYRVRIFGDDIIVPRDTVQPVIRSLERFGAKVNTAKSFWTGRFRESCGKEYYDGEDVSIVRCRRMFPSSLADAAEVTSLVELRNQLYFAGYWATCKWLDEHIAGVLRYYPVVLPSSPALGRHSFLGFRFQKTSRGSHAPLVKAYVRVDEVPSDPLDGTAALLKFVLKRGEEPSYDARHLERAGRPRTASIKPRWVSAI